MYLAKNFVYLELHKTACTHIGHWISQFVDGQQIGKHNVLPSHLRDRFVLGSIRNPWDWYVSLWGYGCDNKGSVWHQSLDRVNVAYYWRQLPSEMGGGSVGIKNFARQFYEDLVKDIEPWRAAYKDSSDPKCFKSWLKLMFAFERRFDVREGYGFSPVAVSSGILGYRFLKFFTSLGENLYKEAKLSDRNGLFEVWDKYKLHGFFIRMEELEEDLIKGLDLAGCPLSSDQKGQLRQAKENKTNTSSRLPPSHYHDDETVRMIAERERLIIDLFDYNPPV